MSIGIWILGNQLSHENTALNSILTEKLSAKIIFIESLNFVQQRCYHQQKLIFIWSAMRHFAQQLQAENYNIDYKIGLDFLSILTAWIQENNITQLRLMLPCDRPFLKLIKAWNLPCQIKFYPNNNFLWQPEEFQQWAKSRKRLILEDFYRESRKKWHILLTENNQPIGGKWNLDKENRQPPKKNLSPPKTLFFPPDNITLEVKEKVKKLNINTYGKSDNFSWAVTRKDALKVLNNFINNCLEKFGKYQDAMITNQEFMWHSLISPYLNIGLLQPLEVIKAVEKTYFDDNLPLNSVEGFIRQILGWREYMYGIYHYVEEDYFQGNYFNHQQPLPDFFWDSSKTKMNCLNQVLKQTENTGYAHHIQRLMILSNYGLIAGISPQALEDWFHSVYIDAYDWVMQTNVLGMGQFADGGILASKPYASSANYIHKMSDYCTNCQYNYKEKSTENACPFNYLYWDFLHRHEDKLKSQGRMNLVLKHLEKISPETWEKIKYLKQLNLNHKINT
ncbi:cryptochrome/photolyase family protein [Geminocystis sp.]|uniref:cryptochrome/photolyase family protein n=1 Tax=Geminocystis sp. TaxID=2664100 RepID=UPI003593E607